MQGQGEEEIAQVRQGIAAYRATGAAVFVPYFYPWLADVSAHLGHVEDGLQALAEAHALVEQQEERWWEAEIARLRGVLLLKHPVTPQEEAETWLRQALDVARRQEAKSLELRAAMQTVPSLPLLWWGVRATLPCKPQTNEEPRRKNEKAAACALHVRT